MPKMNIVMVSHRYPTAKMGIAVLSCRLGIDVVSRPGTVPERNGRGLSQSHGSKLPFEEKVIHLLGGWGKRRQGWKT